MLGGSAEEHLAISDIAPEQEKFVQFLEKISGDIGSYIQMFLSISRKELPRPYALFEGMSFEEMTDILITEDKLHCFDISYVQLFLLSLLKWDTTQGSEHKQTIVDLLKEAQDYEPVPNGSPLPSVQLHDRSHTGLFGTYFANISCVSYEVMMTLKYALSQLLCLSLSSFQYVNWIRMENGCHINWKTFPENYEKIGFKLRNCPSTAALAIDDDFNPYHITFNCNIKNTQILYDGSPLLYPDLDGKMILSMQNIHKN